MLRETEIYNQLKLWGCYLAFNTVGYGSGLFVAFMTFTFYTFYSGNSLDASTAFTGLLLLQQVSDIISFLPHHLIALFQARISFKRIEEFLNEQELERFIAPTENDAAPSNVDNNIIGFENASFVYMSGGNNNTSSAASSALSTESEPLLANSNSADTISVSSSSSSSVFMLKNLCLKFQIGKFNVVCGSTGSGKSSLCLALLGGTYLNK